MPTLSGEDFFGILGKLPSAPFGSLWWVPDSIWKQEIPALENSNRQKHPGLSITQGRLMAQFDPYLFLFGTSNRKKHCVVVRGMSFDNGVPHETFFGVFDPVSLDCRYFSTSQINPCRAKPQIDAREKADLLQLMVRRGWQ